MSGSGREEGARHVDSYAMTAVTVRVAGSVLGMVVGMVVALAACQPVDDFEDLADPASDGGEPRDVDRRGAPATGPPGTLEEALARADGEAARWQDGARLAEAALEVDDAGDLVEGRLTYLAADAERLLTVVVTPEGVRVERPVLEAFDLTPISGDALAALPPLPPDVLEPDQLSGPAQEAFGECGVEGAPANMLYATGAPLAWNPQDQQWAGPLDWTVAVTTAEGGGAVLDPVSARALDCIRLAD